MLIVFVFVFSLPTQLALINASLSVNDALYHIPNYYVFRNAGSIVTGAIFYDEMSKFGTVSWILFPIGVVVLFVGVSCLLSTPIIVKPAFATMMDMLFVVVPPLHSNPSRLKGH